MTKRHISVRKELIGLALFLIVSVVIAGCGGPGDPLTKINSTLQGVPTYSIILDDMKEEGNFFTHYFHKFQVVTPEKSTKTDWIEVSKDFYENNLPFLGMTVYSKQDGKGADMAGPPGYEYVGNSKYGRWETDSSGNSFWAFYGQYAFLSSMLGGGPIYRNNYDTYYSYRSQNRPYYGPNKEYGTNGKVTKTQKPSFYTRKASTETLKKASFSDRVNSRVGRTKTSTRSRSSSVGK